MTTVAQAATTRYDGPDMAPRHFMLPVASSRTRMYRRAVRTRAAITVAALARVLMAFSVGVCAAPRQASGAQAGQTPTFEVASVKPNRTGEHTTTRNVGDGRLTYLNLTLGELIQIAYAVRRYQIDAPDWIFNLASSERYDVVAKSATLVSDEELRRMLAPLLVERFHLLVHREMRTLPVYALVVAKNGPKLTPGGDGEPRIDPDGTGGNRYQNYSMETLALNLSGLPGIGRPVVDRTGLTGHYTFAANLFALRPGLSAADQKAAVATLDGVDSPVFTALQEQLGLKLEAGTAPIEVVVVDHADKVPTEN